MRDFLACIFFNEKANPMRKVFRVGFAFYRLIFSNFPAAKARGVFIVSN